VRTFYSQKGLLRHLVPVATQHQGLLTSLAYISCSNLDALKGQGEAASSLVTKSKAVRAINANLSDRSEATSTENMLAVAALASGVNVRHSINQLYAPLLTLLIRSTISV
jgi:hypothetical protein